MTLKIPIYWALLLLLVCSLSFAQGPSKLRKEEPSLPVEEITRKFAEREKEFRTARANYVYRQDIRVQTLNANDRVTGEWRQIWDVTFDSAGRRLEKVILAPQDTLKGISL